MHIKGISDPFIRRLLIERDREGPFRDLTDFCARLEVEGSQLDLLIRIGAFRFTGKSKSELLWEKNAVFNPRLQREPSLDLFARTVPDHDFSLDTQLNHRPRPPPQFTGVGSGLR